MLSTFLHKCGSIGASSSNNNAAVGGVLIAEPEHKNTTSGVGIADIKKIFSKSASSGKDGVPIAATNASTTSSSKAPVIHPSAVPQLWQALAPSQKDAVDFEEVFHFITHHHNIINILYLISI